MYILKYFPVSALRGTVDCSFHGITETHDRLLLVAPWQGCDQFADYSYPRLYLTTFCGELIALPYDPGEEEIAYLDHGYMFGGNFIWSSDSRFSEFVSPNPIKVYDRNEGKPMCEHEFPQHNLAALREGANLLEQIHHMLATDSDLESVTAAAKYADLKRQADKVLRQLGSSVVPRFGPSIGEYVCPECHQKWHLELRESSEEQRPCPTCGTETLSPYEMERQTVQF